MKNRQTAFSGITPKRRYGQNFLVQKSAIQIIVNTALNSNASQLLEIGPGQGAITELLLMDGRPLWAVDIDPVMVKIISQRFNGFSNFHPICGDAVYVPLLFDGSLSIVGNLPYNAATAIVTRFLLQVVAWEKLVFMFQLEVGQKLIGRPGEKNYGPLSIITQLVCNTSKLIRLGPRSFMPSPKVDSIVIVFEPKANNLKINQRSAFLFFLNASFKYRRKTLSNNLCKYFNLNFIKDLLEEVGLPINIRAEAIAPEAWLTIFNKIPFFDFK